MEININDVKVRVWVTNNSLGSEKGIATIIFGPISINGFKILENNDLHKGATQYWVAPPAYRTKKGKFQSVFWITDKDLWQKIQEKVLQEYNNVLEKKPDLKNGLDGIPIIEETKTGYKKHY